MISHNGGSMSGKTDKRLHDRTKAPDMADRWAATFGKQLAETDKVPDTARHEKHSREECG